MAGKFKVKLKMPVKSLKKIKFEMERLGTWYVFPVQQNPGGIPDQAMPIPAIPGGETDKPFPPMKKLSREDIQKMVAFGAKIYTGEPAKGEKDGPGK